MENSPIVFMFSGQGSQYYQMGRHFFQGNLTFRRELLSLDEVAQEFVGVSIVDTIFAPDKKISNPLDNSVISGLSIFVIEIALVRTLKERGVNPDILLGLSFGTFVSCVVAECLHAEDAIQALVRHGKIFEDTCENGCMLAVLGSLDAFHSNYLLQQVADLAAINYPESFVLSLPQKNLEKVELLLKEENCVFQKMPITTAYHSRWIDDAKYSFFELYGQMNFDPPSISMICSQTTRPLFEVNAQTLWNVVRKPIQFKDTIRNLERFGVYRYVDVGPSGTLATFLRYALTSESKSQAFSILSPYRQNNSNFEELISRLKT